MRKTLTASLLCVFGTLIPAVLSSASAQPSFVWAEKGGGAGADHGYSVATDAAGNVITTGFISTPSATFGGTTLVPTGPASAFIAKYDSHGNLLFARLAGDMGYAEASSVAVDPLGNILLAGVYSGYAVFGPTILNPGAGTGAAFIAKYDSDGRLVWATQVVSTHPNGPGINGISWDSAGNILVAGSAWGNIIFGTDTLTGRGLSDAFVAKLSPSGQFLWAAAGGSTGYDSASSVSADAAGNVVLTGYFDAYGGLGTVATFGAAGLTSRGGGDWFLAKYDATGNPMWATSAGGPGLDIPFSSTIDRSGSIYIGGQFSGSASFGTSYVTGAGSDHMVLVKYDVSGNSLWANAAIGTSRSRGLSVALDTAQNPYLGGEFQGSLDFGVNDLSSAGGFDAFVAKFSPQGNAVWAKRAGGESDDYCYSVAIASDNSIFLGGFVFGPAYFDSVAVTPDANGDIYVAKLEEPTGSIYVTTNLSAATFSISGPAVYSGSGTSFTVARVPLGSYRITYGHVEGFAALADQTGVLEAGLPLSFVGNYVPLPMMSALPQTLAFNYQQGVEGPPQAQNVALLSSSGVIGFVATVTTEFGGDWLVVTPGLGSTGTVLSVNVALGLGPGTYAGRVIVSSAGASNTPLSIAVTLTVTRSADTGFKLTRFPLPGSEADTALITSIFDHSMFLTYDAALYYGFTTECFDGTVTSYRGEQAVDDHQATNRSVVSVKPGKNCANPERLYGFRGNGPFVVNNHYVGAISDGGAAILNYDGHPGFDYRAAGSLATDKKTSEQIVVGAADVLAAADGNAFATGCFDRNYIGPNGEECFGAMIVEHGTRRNGIFVPNGYQTRYLHLSEGISKKEQAPKWVRAGEQIGKAGDTGARGAIHLHFEVRKKNFAGEYVPVDPYGWCGNFVDPYTANSLGVNVNLWSSPTSCGPIQ